MANTDLETTESSITPEKGPEIPELGVLMARLKAAIGPEAQEHQAEGEVDTRAIELKNAVERVLQGYQQRTEADRLYRAALGAEKATFLLSAVLTLTSIILENEEATILFSWFVAVAIIYLAGTVGAHTWGKNDSVSSRAEAQKNLLELVEPDRKGEVQQVLQQLNQKIS